MENKEESFIHLNDFNEVDYFSKYVRCIYFIIISVTGIGYGDYTPQNTNEYIFITIWAIISATVFAWLLNEIGWILK